MATLPDIFISVVPLVSELPGVDPPASVNYPCVPDTREQDATRQLYAPHLPRQRRSQPVSSPTEQSTPSVLLCPFWYTSRCCGLRVKSDQAKQLRNTRLRVVVIRSLQR